MIMGSWGVVAVENSVRGSEDDEGLMLCRDCCHPDDFAKAFVITYKIEEDANGRIGDRD